MSRGRYQEVPGTRASSYQMIDPRGFSQSAFDQMGNTANFARQQLGEYAPTAMSFDPSAGFNQWMSQQGDILGQVQGASSPLEQMLNAQTRRFTEQAAADTASQFSGLGALHSAATRDTASQRAQQSAADAATQLGGQQLGLYGGLSGQAMGAAMQNAMFNPQQAAQLYGQNLGLLGQTTGQMAQFGAPNYSAPQYQYQPGWWQSWGAPMAGQVLGAATGGLFGGG